MFLVQGFFFTFTNSAYPDEIPHDGISPVYKCEQKCTKITAAVHSKMLRRGVHRLKTHVIDLKTQGSNSGTPGYYPNRLYVTLL